MVALLTTFSWQELKLHPWRNATAVFAVMLGVALAFSVHLINAAALGEFASAARSAGGQPDLELRAVQGGFDETLYARIATHPQVALASPVLELQTFVQVPEGRKTVRIVGVDALLVPGIAPAVAPRPGAGSDRFAVFAPDTVFLNAAARQLVAGERIALQVGLAWRSARVAGSVAAGGGPLAVMDLGAAQDFFGRTGQLSRIDVRLAPGVAPLAWAASLDLPASVQVATPEAAGQRVDALSRAYRVNLLVLALVALFTGSFLVFSVLALGVARRSQQFALLGVLGLTARQRLQLVLMESALLGIVGSVLGLALGTGLADAALRLLGGDLGGGYFPGVRPQLQFDAWAAAVYGALGVAAAVAGGWLPARHAARLPLAQTLKGLGAALPAAKGARLGLGAMLAGALLAFAPPVAGIPLAAYASVGLLLVGGITALPAAVGLVYDRIAPRAARHALTMLAVERARRVRGSAAVAVSGVVAALGLAVALTVMVASFRDSVAAWLDVLLPADLYARTAVTSASADAAFLPPEFVARVREVPGVRAVDTQRLRLVSLDAARPAVALLARPLGDAASALPLVGTAVPVPAGEVPVYVSEAVVDLYGAKPGQRVDALAPLLGRAPVVAGVWRDYVRQTGAIAIDAADYRRLTGDERVNELQIRLAPGANAGEVEQRLRALAGPQAGELVEFASAGEIRAISLRIFDRSFAVTYWLQAVAIFIGLFGVAASFGAQVLARRKEFGLLAHLGLTRRQVLAVVAGEGTAWTLVGAGAGLALGLAVAMVLVFVVNPQSFHWTMDLRVPWARLLVLCVAIVGAGTLAAWLAGRAAASHQAVLAVKEDW